MGGSLDPRRASADSRNYATAFSVARAVAKNTTIPASLQLRLLGFEALVDGVKAVTKARGGRNQDTATPNWDKRC